eukprot:8005498-Pyramimonas_sp.AAC.1
MCATGAGQVQPDAADLAQRAAPLPPPIPKPLAQPEAAAEESRAWFWGDRLLVPALSSAVRKSERSPE